MSGKIIALLLTLMLVLSLCTAAAETVGTTVTDMFGREISLPAAVTRVVALEPSDCEILCALGCEEALVGRGLYCDYPASVQNLPALQSGGDTNLEQILALNPQVVIMGDMAHPKEQVDLLEQNGVRVVTTNADSIPEVYECIRLLGQVMGRNSEAESLVADMQSAFDSIAAKSEPTDQTVYFEIMPLEWGLWSAGKNTFMHELTELCGMRNAFADIDGWQPVSEEQVIERNPDFIVLVTGLDDSAIQEVMNRPGWDGISAVKNGRIHNADSYALTRPAPRLKEAALDLFNFLHAAEETPAP